jgi:hypothetical protein
MWKKYFILNLVWVNNISSNKSELETVIQFEDKELHKEFEVKKQIYKEFFIEYMNIFKNKPETFETKMQQITFVKNFIKKYNIRNKWFT